MPELPKRTIEELKARYDYEPAIRDIYVEGFFDVDLVRWFLDCFRPTEVEVYAIETVDVFGDLPDGINPDGGNRTRVIRLANALEHIVQEGRIVCIIDSDFDRVAAVLDPGKETKPMRHLLQTNVTAMEMYLFSVTSIAKLIRLIARNHDVNPPELLADIGSVLRQVFAVRYASVVGGFKFQWLDFTGCCTHRKRYVEFDKDDFIIRLLNKNAAQMRAEEFRSKIASVVSRLPEDPRFAAHGHDFVTLLRWVLRVHGIFTIPNVEFFERVFAACIELGELRTHEFWERLERILGVSATVKA